MADVIAMLLIAKGRFAKSGTSRSKVTDPAFWLFASRTATRNWYRPGARSIDWITRKPVAFTRFAESGFMFKFTVLRSL